MKSSDSQSSAGIVVHDSGEIMANRAKIYELEDAVMHNEFLVAEERSMIEENRELILKNYTAAFMGNCRVASDSTDNIFKIREAILKQAHVQTQVQANHINSMLNETKIDFLEQCVSLNTHIADINERMNHINAELILAVQSVMDGNAQIVKFNSEQIMTNSQLVISGGLDLQEASVEVNGRTIQQNIEHIDALANRLKEHSAIIERRVGDVKINRESITKNTHEIYQRRAEIESKLTTIRDDTNAIVSMLHR